MSIKIENVDVHGWEAAIRGARAPMNSWEKSDSWFITEYAYNGLRTDAHQINNKYTWGEIWSDPELRAKIDLELKYAHEHIPFGGRVGTGGTYIGPNDHKLLMNLCKGGTEESKWRRFVNVTMDITAPLYWWKEFETYKVGTVSNSCSTMHKIHAKEFTLEDFSCEHLIFDADVPDEEFENLSSEDWDALNEKYCGLDNSNFVDFNQFPGDCFSYTIDFLNRARELYLKTKDDDLNVNGTILMHGDRKKYWYQMIQLLPTSYNQRRTIQLNYEVLAAQYRQRKGHKLTEWAEYLEWIRSLPYNEFITMEN